MQKKVLGFALRLEKSGYWIASRKKYRVHIGKCAEKAARKIIKFLAANPCAMPENLDCGDELLLLIARVEKLDSKLDELSKLLLYHNH